MTTIKPSEWGASLKPSPTLSLHKQVQDLLGKGIRVHDFGIGEMQPEITIPDVMKNGMKDAIDHNLTYYVSASGDSELLQALSDDFARNFNFSYSTKQIAICPVRFEAFENIPFLITGKHPIRLPTDEKFYPVVEELEKLLETDDSIALIIINSPNNPSGAVYPASLLERLSEVIKRYPHIAVIFDEVDLHKYIAKFLPQQTLTVGGASKEVAGTGVRVGYVAGPEELISVICKIQGNTSACVSLPCQKGFAKLLQADKDMKIRFGIRARLQEKRDYLLAAIKKHKALSSYISLQVPEGAFYAFPNVEGLYGKRRPDGVVIGNSDFEVATFLIEIANVATVPGSSFGRSAYASRSITQIDEGVQAIADAVAKLT